MKKSLLLLMLLLVTSSIVFSQTNNKFWAATNNALAKSSENRILKELPNGYELRSLSIAAFQTHLQAVPQLEDVAKQVGFLLEMPTPEGNLRSFRIFENDIIAPEVRHEYTLKTYQGYAEGDESLQIRCTMSEAGFNAMVYDKGCGYILEPLSKNDSRTHIVYYKSELNTPKVQCGFDTALHGHKHGSSRELKTPNQLRTFRIALVASGEFSQQFGGSPYMASNVLNQLATGLNNMIIPIYVRDMGVTFTLVSGTNLVFQNPADDPFDLSDQDQLIVDNHTECVDALGANGFDIGHLFVWANTGGLAAADACGTSKGEGFSGSDASLASIFIDYGCHEIGHQFGGDHNFVSQECGTSSADFRYEPGEGSSIMAYAGVCGPPASYQSTSDPFFHTASINAMQSFISSSATCGASSGTANSAAPTADAKMDITIPKQTPFVLVGSGADTNDPASQLTYLWQQYDGASAAVTSSPNCSSTDAPLFRFRSPVSESYRVFPQMSDVLAGNNNTITWEKLPCAARMMNFNMMVRDNNTNWGRTASDDMKVTVANTGPFEVTAPNGGESWTMNPNTITWSENGTAAHCPNVDILLSTDSGATYTVVATGVTNDGSHDVTLPSTMSTTARILVQCSVEGNFQSASTFFDVSNTDFSVDVQSMGIELDARVFLQGPLSGSAMNTNLTSLLPTTEPYTALGTAGLQNAGATSTTTIFTDENIVDWVVVEIRDASFNVMASRAALVSNDGYIYDTDGISFVRFEGIGSGSYHVAVHHRNHLGVMTKTPLAFTAN